jgi:hypothetical protein
VALLFCVFRNKSGSLAIFTAMRRAFIRVSKMDARVVELLRQIFLGMREPLLNRKSTSDNRFRRP